MAVGIYFGLVALITTVTPDGTVPSLFAIAAVGLVVVPSHRVLQGFFGRLVYGDRADPLRALSRVAEGIRVRDAHDPSGLRPMLTGIARALRSPYVALHGPDGEDLAGVGVIDGQPVHAIDLEYAGEPVGRLTVAGRTTRDPLGAADRRLLEALSVPVAAAVRAGLTARELAESRSRVLAVREGERRRLREDLHDGLGPSLSGVALGLEAARRSVGTRSGRLPEILDVLHREVDSLVAEVRGIIDDLGPAEVDLLAAVRSHVDAVAAAGDVSVELTETGDLSRVPGEVAVTAHRIAGEALTNAARHAGAARIRVALSGHPDHLVVEVADDGTGAVRPRPGGVGLDSMRQRAESVGGVPTVTAVPDRGTRVRAVLPLRAAT
jgi:signal transduction histidine kinase